jgi:hypothetical protein
MRARCACNGWDARATSAEQNVGRIDQRAVHEGDELMRGAAASLAVWV